MDPFRRDTGTNPETSSLMEELMEDIPPTETDRYCVYIYGLGRGLLFGCSRMRMQYTQCYPVPTTKQIDEELTYIMLILIKHIDKAFTIKWRKCIYGSVKVVP